MKQALSDFILPRIHEMHAYVPGLQTEDPQIIKLNTNENPFPISKSIKDSLIQEIESDVLQKYPDAIASKLRTKIAEKHGRTGDCVIVGNGSDEILSLIFRAVLDVEDRLIFPNPTYSLYPVLADMIGANSITVDVKNNWRLDFNEMLNIVGTDEKDSNHTPLVVIANPNAPTGIAESRDDLLNFTSKNPVLTLIDEAYIEFGGDTLGDIAGTDEYSRLMVSGTFSKAYSLAGQRIGWLIAHPSLIIELDKIRDSYNLSRLSQVAGLAALNDSKKIKEQNQIVIENREWLKEKLEGLGFHVLPSSANFIFTKPPDISKTAFTAARAYYDFLLESKILIRYFTGKRIDKYVRITIGRMEELERLVEVTQEFLRKKNGL